MGVDSDTCATHSLLVCCSNWAISSVHLPRPRSTLNQLCFVISLPFRVGRNSVIDLPGLLEGVH
jgi:hypothetical protein